MNCAEGGVRETTRRFQVASAAFIHPARSPTRGSGRGAVVDISSFDVAQAAAADAAIANATKRGADAHQDRKAGFTRGLRLSVRGMGARPECLTGAPRSTAQRA